MKIATRAFTIPLLVCLSACTFDPVEIEAELRTLTVFPKYFCSGQTALFSFEGFLVDEVNIYKRDQSLLLNMISPPQPGDEPARWNGSGITPPMERDWLPLTVNFRSNIFGEDETYPFPSHEFVNIDEEEWAGIYQDTTELSGEPYHEHTANSQEYDSESESVIQVPHYDVKADFYGFRWRIPYEFSSRATLVKIMNLGQRTMTFTISGVQGEYRLAPNQQSIELPTFSHPAGIIEARYDPPETRLIGKQKGEYTKPENEHYSYQDLYVEHVSPLSLLVRCGDT